MDLAVDIIFWCIVIWIVSKFCSLYLQARQEILREEIKELSEQLKNKIIHVNVEKYGSVFYLYEKDTHRFIAQGIDMNELREKCNVLFKDAVIIADEEEIKKYGLE
jgi:hypothetical protein